MTFEDVAFLYHSWGWQIKPQHYDGYEAYFREMLKRNRVIFVTKDEQVVALITFFLTNDYDKLYRKPMWAVPNDEPDGKQIYVDKMICQEWTPTLRREFQDYIERVFPNVMEGYYHRAPKDRCVKIYRRRQLCTK